MIVFLVRHGEVAPVRPGAYYGGTEVPLSERGLEEARQAARFLADCPLDGVCSSPLGRARRGAEEILRLQPGRPLRLVPDFREIDRGAWTGWTPEELERLRPGEQAAEAADPAGWKGHGGESRAELRQRVLRAFDALVADARERGWRRWALVSHLWPTRAVLARALGREIEEWEEIPVPTGSISALEPEAGRVLWTGRRPGIPAPPARPL